MSDTWLYGFDSWLEARSVTEMLVFFVVLLPFTTVAVTYPWRRKARKKLSMPLWFPGIVGWFHDRKKHKLAMEKGLQALAVSNGWQTINEARSRGELPLPKDQVFDDPIPFKSPEIPTHHPHKHKLAYLGRTYDPYLGECYEFVCVVSIYCNFRTQWSIESWWGFVPTWDRAQRARIIQEMNTQRSRRSLIIRHNDVDLDSAPYVVDRWAERTTRHQFHAK